MTLRVLDLTDSLSLQAGRLLVGLGADVIRLARSTDSDSDSAGDSGRGRAAELHWHAGKRVLRANDESLTTTLLRLLPQANVVIESGAAQRLLTLGLREEHPLAWRHVAHVLVTPFGLTGPRRDWLADDLVAAAAGGMAWLGGTPGQPPQPPPHEQAGQLAGTHAVIAALLTLFAKQRIGTGQLAEISVQEAVAATLETGAVSWIHGRTLPVRSSGVYAHVAHRVFAGADGYLAGGYSGSNRMWDGLLAWMVEADAAEDLADPRWQDAVTRWQGRAHVDAVVGRFVARYPVREFAAAARDRALPWAEVAAAVRLPDNPQLQDRQFFTQITGVSRHLVGGQYRVGAESGADSENRVGAESLTDGENLVDVGFPFASAALSRPVRLAGPEPVGVDVTWRPAPAAEEPSELVGQHPRATVGLPRPASTASGHPQVATGKGALDGVRVLDLTWVLAGPYVTKTLGEHGAQIVKVESKHRQDPTRFAPSMRLRPGASHDESGYFLNFNRNKQSLALNLRTAEGVALLHRLVAESDILVENFSPGVMDKWGLGYPELARIKPGIVLVSMAGVGQSGPWRRAVTFADTLAAMSGLTAATGDPGGPPHGLTFGLGDMVAANAAVIGALDLLLAGKGGHLDLSQLEAMAAQVGPALLEAQLSQNTAGSRAVPELPAAHSVLPGVYPVRGDDRWIAIGAGAERTRLTELIGTELLASEPLAPDLLVPEPLGPAGSGAKVADTGLVGGELTATALAQWTAGQDGPALVNMLQENGIPAYLVQDGRDLVENDEQLRQRGFYVNLEHPLVGSVAHEGLVAHLADTPGALLTPAPLLGQHTDDLLRDLLGLDDDELGRLHDEGVLE